MKRFFRNPWTWILLPPPILFAVLMLFAVPADWVVLTFGLLVFLAIAVVAGKYVIRAPALIYEGNIENQAVNIVGFALVLLSLMGMQTYRWVVINLNRPDWISQQYWSAGMVYVMFVGFILVAWSTRRAATAPPNGRVGLGGWFVGLISGIGLMASGVLPMAAKMSMLAFGKLVAFLPH